MIGKILIGGVLAYGAFRLYEAVSLSHAGDKLDLSVAGINFKGVQAGVGQFELVFNAVNPTGTGIALTFLNLNAKLPSGQTLATFNNLGVTKIFPAHSNTQWALPFKVSTLSLIAILGTDLISLIQKKFTLPDKVLITGSVTAGGFDVPYNEAVSLGTDSIFPPKPNTAKPATK